MWWLFLGLARCIEDTIAFTNCSCQTLYTVPPMKAPNVAGTWYMYYLRLKLFSHCGSIDCKLMSDWHLDLNRSIDTCSILTKFFQRSLKCLLLSVSVVFSYQHLLAILLQILQPFFVVLEFCLNFKLKYSPQVHPFTFTHI